MTAKHGGLLLGSLALVLTTAGCGDRAENNPSTSPAGASASDEELDLPTSDWAGGVSEEASISGTLAVDADGCVFLGGRARQRLYAMWPAGFSASIGPEGARLFDTDGDEAAAEGDTVEMSGGYHQVSESHPCIPVGGTEVAVVQSQVTVTARATDTTVKEQGAAMESGTKQVGLNGVAVSIPTTWDADDACSEASLRVGKAATVYSGCVPGDPSRSSSVVLFNGPRKGAGVRLGDLRPAGRVGGHAVLESIGVCQLSAPGRCSQGFGIPDLNAWFLVTVWSDQGGLETIGRIRDSLTSTGGEPRGSATSE